MEFTTLAWLVSLTFAVVGWWPSVKQDTREPDVLDDGKASEAPREVHTISSPRLC